MSKNMTSKQGMVKQKIMTLVKGLTDSTGFAKNAFPRQAEIASGKLFSGFT